MSPSFAPKTRRIRRPNARTTGSGCLPDPQDRDSAEPPKYESNSARSIAGQNDRGTNLRLEQSVRDAELLMRYAGRYGVPIDSSVLIGIADAREQFQRGELKGQKEAEFYEKFISLSRAVAPVSVKSLESCTEQRDLTDFFFWHRSETYADRTIRRHRVFGGIGLMLLILVQTYWVVGSYLTANIPLLSDTDSDRKQAILQESIYASGSTIAITKEGEAASLTIASDGRAPAGIDSEKLKNEEGTIVKGRLRTYEWLLDLWAAPEIAVVKWVDKRTKSPVKHEVSDSWRNGILAKYFLNILQTYVLPPLYGWIGAVAFVLRRLISEINARTYREDTNILYNLRIFLGLLAGLAIGWFFPPNNAEGQHVLQALSPLALAFLAGYSVELLFAAMDRLLDAFSANRPSKE